MEGPGKMFRDLGRILGFEWGPRRQRDGSESNFCDPIQGFWESNGVQDGVKTARNAILATPTRDFEGSEPAGDAKDAPALRGAGRQEENNSTELEPLRPAPRTL